MLRSNGAHRSTSEFVPVPRREVWVSVVVLAALVFGTYIRVWHFGDQVVADDECHTLEASLEEDPIFIATHHRQESQRATYSIPLALWNQLLLRTVGLDEWGMRAPVLLCGLLLLPLISRFAIHRVGWLEGVTVAWLAAASPILILYSRFARPYMGACLLTLLAVMGWLGWLRSGRWRWGLVSALCAAGALYLNPFAGPAIASLWGYGLLTVIWRHRQAPRPTPWHAILLVLSGVLAFGLLIGPTVPSLLEMAQQKAGFERPGALAWWGALQFLYGTSMGPVLIWLLITTAVGAILAWKRTRWLTGLLLLMTAASVAGVQAVAPYGGHRADVLGRYVVAVWPFVLVFLAAGLAAHARLTVRLLRIDASTRSGRFASLAVAGLLVGILVWCGPLPTVFRSPNAFTNRIEYYAPPHLRVDPSRIPSIYASLSKMESDVRIAEFPWLKQWRHTVYADYQSLHGKPVKTLSWDPMFRGDGVEFRSVISVDELEFHLGEFDYVIVHKSIDVEIPYVRGWTIQTLDRETSNSVPEARSPSGQALPDKLASGLWKAHEDEWLSVHATSELALRRLRAVEMDTREAQ